MCAKVPSSLFIHSLLLGFRNARAPPGPEETMAPPPSLKDPSHLHFISIGQMTDSTWEICLLFSLVWKGKSLGPLEPLGTQLRVSMKYEYLTIMNRVLIHTNWRGVPRETNAVVNHCLFSSSLSAYWDDVRTLNSTSSVFQANGANHLSNRRTKTVMAT